MEMHIPYWQTFIIHQMAYIFSILINPLLQWKQLLCDRNSFHSMVVDCKIIFGNFRTFTVVLNIQIDREFRGNDVLSLCLSLYTLLKTTKVIMFLAPYLTFCSNWLFDFLRQGYKFVDLKMTHK